PILTVRRRLRRAKRRRPSDGYGAVSNHEARAFRCASQASSARGGLILRDGPSVLLRMRLEGIAKSQRGFDATVTKNYFFIMASAFGGGGPFDEAASTSKATGVLPAFSNSRLMDCLAPFLSAALVFSST